MNSRNPTPEQIGFVDTEIRLTPEQRQEINNYAHGVLDGYSAACLEDKLYEAEGMKPGLDVIAVNRTTFPVGKLPNFWAFDNYVFRGKLISSRPELEKKIEDVPAFYNKLKDKDYVDLRLGPVNLETGETIIIFNGVQYAIDMEDEEADRDPGEIKTFGFIYEPSVAGPFFRSAAVSKETFSDEFEAEIMVLSALCAHVEQSRILEALKT